MSWHDSTNRLALRLHFYWHSTCDYPSFQRFYFYNLNVWQSPTTTENIQQKHKTHTMQNTKPQHIHVIILPFKHFTLTQNHSTYMWDYPSFLTFYFNTKQQQLQGTPKQNIIECFFPTPRSSFIPSPSSSSLRGLGLTSTLHHCLSIAYLSIPCGQSCTDYVHMSGLGRNRTMRNRFIYLTHPSTSCLYYWDVFLYFPVF